MISNIRQFIVLRVRTLVSIAFALLALLDIAFLEVTWVSVALLGLAFLPWILPYIRPNSGALGFTVDALALAQAIASLRSRDISDEEAGRVQKYEREDYNLTVVSLMRLRRDLEVEVRDTLDLQEPHRFNWHTALGFLEGQGLLTAQSRNELMSALSVMNAAVHGKELEQAAMERALVVGLDLLEKLGARKC